MNKKPDNHATWMPHIVEGWYVSPALQSYQCYHTWINYTHQEWIADTLTWFPSPIPVPMATATDIIASATQDILLALKHPLQGTPLTTIDNDNTEALKILTKILHNTNITENVTPPLRVLESDNTHTPTTNADNMNQPETYTNKNKPRKQKSRKKTDNIIATETTTQATAFYVE